MSNKMIQKGLAFLLKESGTVVARTPKASPCEFNSLDAQYEASKAYIRSQAHAGWTQIKSRYDDGGFSGGNTDRPALQQLLLRHEIPS